MDIGALVNPTNVRVVPRRRRFIAHTIEGIFSGEVTLDVYMVPTVPMNTVGDTANMLDDALRDLRQWYFRSQPDILVSLDIALRYAFFHLP